MFVASSRFWVGKHLYYLVCRPEFYVSVVTVWKGYGMSIHLSSLKALRWVVMLVEVLGELANK